jgi:hypothetical protein
VSLALYMGSYLVSAAEDLVWIPAGYLHRRFVGWTRGADRDAQLLIAAVLQRVQQPWRPNPVGSDLGNPGDLVSYLIRPRCRQLTPKRSLVRSQYRLRKYLRTLFAVSPID